MLFSNEILHAQQDPIKFGKIDKSVLEMKSCEIDTTADAVVVCDYGDFDPNTFSFERIYRLKILKKSGCDRANFAVQVRSASDISGFTYNLVNGEIVRTKLKKESVFEEDIDHKYFRYKISMPNVQVGSIIDIRFRFEGIPYAWYFQSDIPILWSELRLYPRSEVGIQKNFFGFEKLDINESDRWVAKNMPALKQEPYMNNLDNFLMKFEFEYSFIHIPGLFIDFATTWDAVNSYLLNKSTLGRELETLFFMSDEVTQIENKCKTDIEKVLAAYDTIHKRIKWNNQEYLYPRYNSSIQRALKKGSGNAGEVNTALLLLLRKLNIQAYPVALSTRSNGMLSFIPSLDKLNYMVVLAKVDGKDILLDATEDYLPINYLPERCVNGNGRLVDDKSSIWINLKPGGKDKNKYYADFTLNKEGIITGNFRTAKYDYASYLFRKKYSEYNDKDDFIKELEKKNPGIKILDNSISNFDSIYKPIIIYQQISYTGDIDIDDTSIIFNPFIIDRLLSNPLKNDSRKIPVDFIYPSENNYVFHYKLPDGFKIQNIPRSINLALPGNSGKFSFQTMISDSTIQIAYNLNISNTLFDQENYYLIQQLFAEVVKKLAEPIILIKK